MSLPRAILPGRLRAVPVCTTSVAAGGMIGLFSTNTSLLAIAAGVLVGLPLAVVAVFVSPSLAVGALVGTQFLGGYEFDTPVGAITVPTMILALVLFAYLPRIADAIRLPSVRLALVLAALFLGGRVVELAHEPPASVVRTLAQAASYGAMLAVGVWIGVEGRLRPVAAGAAFTLLTMGALGIGVSLGIVPTPNRLNDARTIFGVLSPFVRNYGSNLPNDATALLVPLCVPYFAVGLMTGRARQRLKSGVVLVLLGLSFFYVFQARSMIVQWVAAILLVPALTRGWPARLASIGALLVLSVVAITGSLSEVSPISSALRADGWRTGITILTSSLNWVFVGVGTAGTMDAFLRLSEWGRILQPPAGFQPVHNLFLNAFVETGLFEGLTLVGLTCVVAARLLWSRRAGPQLAMLRIAFVLVIIAVMVDPIQAKALGLWMTFGIALGWTSRGVSEPRASAGREEPGEPEFATAFRSPQPQDPGRAAGEAF